MTQQEREELEEELRQIQKRREHDKEMEEVLARIKAREEIEKKDPTLKVKREEEAERIFHKMLTSDPDFINALKQDEDFKRDYANDTFRKVYHEYRKQGKSHEGARLTFVYNLDGEIIRTEEERLQDIKYVDPEVYRKGMEILNNWANDKSYWGGTKGRKEENEAEFKKDDGITQ